MDKWTKRYLVTLDEIHKAMPVSLALAERPEDVVEDVLSYLIDAYLAGSSATAEMLDLAPLLVALAEPDEEAEAPQTDVDTAAMESVIYLPVEGKTFSDRVLEYALLDDVEGIRTVAETEYHRVYNTAADQTARSAPGQVSKRWRTVGDNVVREAHRYLEGVEVPLDAEFYTYDGDHAAFPGGFTQARNNVNCRCIVTYTRGREATQNNSQEAGQA
nr:MAG TPA: minor capsid protein [Caudoviricetes sp.]